MNMSRLTRRAAAAAAAASAAVLISATPALAHVSVQPASVPQGGYSTVNFTVPNEEAASTVKVEVNLPLDHPIASVSVQPVAGWTAQVTKSKLASPIKTDDGTVEEAVTKVTWSGGKIATGQFQQFPVALGPLPSSGDEVAFKVLQTYDNGDVARWINVPKPGQPEPEDPAAVLKLTAAGSGEGSGSAADGTPSPLPASPADAAAVAANAAAGGSDGTARALGITGIVVGVLGTAMGIWVGRRRSSGGSPA